MQQMLDKLPEKWALKYTEETAEEIEKYRFINYDSSCTFKKSRFEYMKDNGSGIKQKSIDDKDYIEISFEDFKRLVLKEKTEFQKGDYIVILNTKECNYFKTNYIFYNFQNYHRLFTNKCCKGEITNGGVEFKNKETWRYATKEEITEYEKLGKPYDVTTLNKSKYTVGKWYKETNKGYFCKYLKLSSNGGLVGSEHFVSQYSDLEYPFSSAPFYNWVEANMEEVNKFLPDRVIQKQPIYDAVAVKTQEEWDFVTKILGYNWKETSLWEDHKEKSMINLKSIGYGTNCYKNPCTFEQLCKDRGLTFESNQHPWYVVVTEENQEVCANWREIGKHNIPIGYIISWAKHGTSFNKEHNPSNKCADYDFGKEITTEEFYQKIGHKPKDKKTLTYEELIFGNIYVSLMPINPEWESLHKYNNLSKEKFKERLYISDKYKGERFNKETCGKVSTNSYRLATDLEIQWFNDCVKAGKFVDKSTKNEYVQNNINMTVEEYLIKEAKERFPIGCTVKGTMDSTIAILEHTFNLSNNNCLYYYNGLVEIYDGYKWATIVSTPNESELDIWLRETKAKIFTNPYSLECFINVQSWEIVKKLEGASNKDKAQILWDKWNKQSEGILSQIQINNGQLKDSYLQTKNEFEKFCHLLPINIEIKIWKEPKTKKEEKPLQKLQFLTIKQIKIK